TVTATLTRITDEADFLEGSGIGTRGAIRGVQKQVINLRRELLQTGVRLRGTTKNPAPTGARSVCTKSAQRLCVAATQLGYLRPRAPESIKKKLSKVLEDTLAELKKVRTLVVSETASSEMMPWRLVQQILSADVWFAPPPVCYVLFPEAYETLQYNRNYLQEPTRFLLKTNDEFFGEDELFDRYYFAPHAGNVKGDRTRLNDLMKG